MSKKSNIAVVGGGVIGLSTAVYLLENGFTNITIIAEQLHPHITSSVACAIWMPYKVEPEQGIIKWAKPSLARYTQLAENAEFGIYWQTLLELYQEKMLKPSWMDLLPITTTPQNAIIPVDCQDHFALKTLLIDTSIYLPRLQQYFLQLDGKIEQRKLSSLNELHEYSVVINCTGIGARALVNDNQLYPIRGQLIKLTKPKNLDFSVMHTIDHLHFTHVFPRHHDCIVGGTIEPNEWDTTPNTAKTQQIMERALKLVPQLAQEKIIAEVVGLRPARAAVRLEAETVNQKQLIIHNYGHGGAGITLAWGCAAEVLMMLNQ